MNYSSGHPGMYGSTDPVVLTPMMTQKRPFVRGMRQSLNGVAILMSLFFPWLLFCVVFWAMSFTLHYKNPFWCYMMVLAGLCVVAVLGVSAFDAIKNKKKASSGQMQFVAGGDVSYHEPTWIIFMFITCLFAWLLGLVAGDVNFYTNMEPFYDVSNLNTYRNVDPSSMRGTQLMDAGRISFTADAKLDVSMSMGFKNLNVYCVAPIVSGSDPKHMASYDFWAVGMDCCSGSRADFHCGEFNNARAAAGLRLMRDDQRPFFRLAVQQAEAAYKIRACHPLFFQWMADPIEHTMAYSDEGNKWYLVFIFMHFAFQLFLVAIACLAFSKMGTLA